MTAVFTLIASLLSLYLAICMFRILLTWFGPSGQHPALRFITQLTDFWMLPFSRIKQLRLRNLDFSPILALIVLQVITQMFWGLAQQWTLTPGIVIALFLDLTGSAINFLFVFFIILTIARLIGIFAKLSSLQTIWFTLDHILQPMVYPILAKLFPRRVVPYGSGLLIFLAILLGLAVSFHFLFTTLATLVLQLGA